MKKNMKFDAALKELERIVTQLESQDMPLEKAMSSFEAAVKLTRHCNRLLDEAEQKIKLLTETPGGRVEEKDWTD